MKVLKRGIIIFLSMFVAVMFFYGTSFLVRVKAEESVPVGNVVDMTRTSYVNIIDDFVGAEEFKTALYDYFQADGTNLWWDNAAEHRNALSIDKESFVVYKVKVPDDTTYLSMHLQFHQGNMLIYLSGDGNFSNEATYDIGAEWYFDKPIADISRFLNSEKEVYIKFADKTPEDGNGPLVERFRLSHNGTIVPPKDTVEASKVTEDIEISSFIPVSGALGTEPAGFMVYENYGANNGGYNESGKFHWFDAVAAGNRSRGQINSAIGIYKMTYTDQAERVYLKVSLGGDFILSVAKDIDVSNEEECFANAKYLNSKWVNYRCGKPLANEAKEYTIDVTAFKNDSKEIFFRVGDASDQGGNGGLFFGATLYETRKISAPVVTKPEDMTVETRTFSEIILPEIEIESKDKNCSVIYTVKDSQNNNITVSDKKFVPTGFDSYSVTVTVTDNNNASTTTSFMVKVVKKLFASPVIETPKDQIIFMTELGEIIISEVKFTSEDKDAIITYVVKDGAGKEVSVVNGKFTPDSYGDYFITATVKDSDDQTQSVTYKITVQEEKTGCGSILIGNSLIFCVTTIFIAGFIVYMLKRKKYN